MGAWRGLVAGGFGVLVAAAAGAQVPVAAVDDSAGDDYWSKLTTTEDLLGGRLRMRLPARSDPGGASARRIQRLRPCSCAVGHDGSFHYRAHENTVLIVRAQETYWLAGSDFLQGVRDEWARIQEQDTQKRAWTVLKRWRSGSRPAGKPGWWATGRPRT
jgi:hypothetical protein